MPLQVVPNQQHTQDGEPLVQRMGVVVPVPIHPTATNHRRGWSRWTLLQDRCQFLLQPRMQDGVGRSLHLLGPHFTRGWPKQRELLDRAPSDVLVGLARRLPFQLPGLPCLGDHLIGPSFILPPHLQTQFFTYPVGSLDEPLFCSAAGSSTRTTPSLRLRKATPVLHQVRLRCQVYLASCNTCIPGCRTVPS